jgi:DNA-binding MarR family transcriptional regulator
MREPSLGLDTTGKRLHIQHMVKRRTEEDPAAVIASECLAYRTRLLNRTVTRIYDEALRPVGLTAAQLNLLVAIARFGPDSPGAIAKRLNMEKSTMSRNVTRLAEHGQIGVTPGASGREQLLRIRAKGSNLIKRALPLWQSAQERTIALLGDDGAHSLRDAAATVQRGRG